MGPRTNWPRRAPLIEYRRSIKSMSICRYRRVINGEHIVGFLMRCEHQSVVSIDKLSSYIDGKL